MRELMAHQKLFIGFKADGQLRNRLEALDDAGMRYVSAEESAFLQICGLGEDLYVGKIVDGRLTTDRVEDIRRNVLSIIRKIGHETHLPTHLHIYACSPQESKVVVAGTQTL